MVVFSLFKESPDDWFHLESEIHQFTEQYELNLHSFQLRLIPQVGVVMCPWSRQIAWMDCLYKLDAQNQEEQVGECFYYQIAIKN